MREPINGIKVELNFAWHEPSASTCAGLDGCGSNAKPAAEVMTDEPPIPVSSF